MRMFLAVLFAAGLLVAAFPARADEKKAPAKAADKDCECCKDGVLKIGAVAYAPKSVDVFRGLRYYFARSGMPIEFVLYSTYDGLNEALLKGQVDLAWNSPLGHAKFHLAAGDSQAVVMRDVDRNYRVKLIVRKDANVSTLDDLAGKTMVFGSCDSADCTVLPIHFLKKEGVNFDKVKVLSLHKEVDARGIPCHSAQHVWQALVDGRGQAGIIGADMWKNLQTYKPEQARQFKEIWTSPPFSHCVFTARKDFNKETAAKFTKLMLAMGGKDPVAAEILKLEHCSKWVPAGAEAQQGYGELLKALRQENALPAALRK
ncbi:MAG TPA: PhnD/SsuA/transferrin family substrate-binding protein [Gemmataceae bacterium]|nr:PhnD/SsuA/transferrin family substrate-binding protein [Gemmataceae bacterium]